jgi:hypothetical protein
VAERAFAQTARDPARHGHRREAGTRAEARPEGVSARASELYDLWVEDAQDPEWTASIAELRQRLERSTGT